MPKKKTVGPETPAASMPAAARRRTSGASGASRKVAAVRPDPGIADPGATPMAEPLDSAADMSVGASSSDSAAMRDPSYDEIAAAAYLRYLDRGASDGRDFDDWLEAERSLRRSK